jgi:predicted transcriptional regulator
MKEKLPQEIEVWELLPAIRKAFALSFVHDFKLSQKNAAELLHLTEPAVSQYLTEKRGKTILFNEAILNEIHNSAERIKENKSAVFKEIKRICDLIEVKKIVCTIHKGSNTTIPCDCDVCLS